MSAANYHFQDSISHDIKKGKNIILCIDGTCENFGPHPFTNVLKLYKLLENSDPSKQICYYQPGIGIAADCDPVTDFRRRFTLSSFRNMLDSMFAFNIGSHVQAAYSFLIKYYETGDRIYMFGFSRGAFIARVLAGMIEKVGLLSKGQDNLVQMAWKVYIKWEYEKQPIQPNYTTTLVQEFKKTFCRNEVIKITFQGLFDSVNSVGIFRDKLFPCTQKCQIVEHVRHCLSLDERRGKFKQFCIEPTLLLPKKTILSYRHYICPSQEHTPEFHNANHSKLSITTRGVKLNQNKIQSNTSFVNIEGTFKYEPIEALCDSAYTSIPDLIEMWFPGDHADVGGGWALDGETMESSSNISLRWMISEAIKFGVSFNPTALKNYTDQATSVGSLFADTHDYLKLHVTRHDIKLDFKKNRVDINGFDLAPLANIRAILKAGYEKKLYNAIARNDLIIKAKYGARCGRLKQFLVFVWWLLEFIPVSLKLDKPDGSSREICFPNLGRSRHVPEYALLHWSVFWKLRFSKNYRPTNLPKYVKNLLSEMEGLVFNKSNYRDNSAGDISKMPYIFNTNCNNGREAILRQSSNLSISSTLINETLHDRVSQETREMLLKWVEEKWQHVPDDLEGYL
ncbi:Uncharacterized alpha/beta hydrolase domain (DUF2235) [Nakaseomyces glabratus]|nr:Uncharacterized alpha/beta hydrolase domain (DUF2235) [Nakaseomyces glabratus]